MHAQTARSSLCSDIATGPGLTPEQLARGPPLWDDCDVRAGEGVAVKLDW